MRRWLLLGAALRVVGAATRFERLTATLRIADQRARSEDVTLTAEDFAVDTPRAASASPARSTRAAPSAARRQGLDMLFGR